MKRKIFWIFTTALVLFGGIYLGIKATRWIPVLKLYTQMESDLSREDWDLYSGECFVVQVPEDHKVIWEFRYEDRSLHILDRQLNEGEWDRLIQTLEFDQPDVLVRFSDARLYGDSTHPQKKEGKALKVGGFPAIWREEEEDEKYSGLIEIYVPFPIHRFLDGAQELIDFQRPRIIAFYDALSAERRDRAMEIIQTFRVDFSRKNLALPEDSDVLGEMALLLPMERTQPLQSLEALKSCGLRREGGLQPAVEKRSLAATPWF